MHRFSHQSAGERDALSRLRQILRDPGLLRASWVKMKHPCGKDYCRCSKDKRHWHLSWYASQSKDGKPRMKCVPKEHLEKVRLWVNRYQEAKTLLARVGDLYWDQISVKKKSR